MRSRRSLLVVAAVIVVIALVAIASYFMSSHTRQDPSAATSPTPEPTRISEYGFPVSHLRLNEGGTQTAPDGRTRIGYTPSCDDAVRAAVNYSAADSYAAESWAGNEETLKHVLLMNKASTEYIDVARWGALEKGIVFETSLLEPKIFNLATCDSGKSATVAVAVRTKTNSYQFNGKTIPETTEIRVAEHHLAWEDSDWKLDMSANYTRPEAQLLYLEDKKEPSSTSEILGELFTDSDGNPLSRDGWVELSR